MAPVGIHLDENRIVAFVDGRLQRAGAALVRTHVDGCAHCRRVIAAVVAGADAATGPAEHDTLVDVLPSHATSSSSLPAGERVAGYVVEKAIGAGGMGIVYRARSARDS